MTVAARQNCHDRRSPQFAAHSDQAVVFEARQPAILGVAVKPEVYWLAKLVSGTMQD